MVWCVGIVHHPYLTPAYTSYTPYTVHRFLPLFLPPRHVGFVRDGPPRGAAPGTANGFRVCPAPTSPSLPRILLHPLALSQDGVRVFLLTLPPSIHSGLRPLHSSLHINCPSLRPSPSALPLEKLTPGRQATVCKIFHRGRANQAGGRKKTRRAGGSLHPTGSDRVVHLPTWRRSGSQSHSLMAS